MRIQEVILYRVRLPLPTPYKVAFKTYTAFDPFIVEVRDRDGRGGWGEAHIPEGYSKKETPAVGWDFCCAFGEKITGMKAARAKDAIATAAAASPMAATALVSALEALEDNPIFRIDQDARIPLLAPLRAKSLDQIPDEVDRIIERGFKTIKVKVGWDVEPDLARVEAARQAAHGRALVRLDANRNFSQEDGCRFARGLNPDGIELFEQPCDSDDWDANAAVAAVSAVPVMLDESIYGVEDVERAGTIEGVDYCKVKLKRAGGIDLLMATMRRCRELGMGAIVGDGVATEIGNLMEACCARLTTDLAGEMNGFLKPTARLFANPLPFDRGDIILEAGFRPVIDRHALAAHTLGSERFTETGAAVHPSP